MAYVTCSYKHCSRRVCSMLCCSAQVSDAPAHLFSTFTSFLIVQCSLITQYRYIHLTKHSVNELFLYKTSARVTYILSEVSSMCFSVAQLGKNDTKLSFASQTCLYFIWFEDLSFCRLASKSNVVFAISTIVSQAPLTNWEGSASKKVYQSHQRSWLGSTPP